MSSPSDRSGDVAAWVSANRDLFKSQPGKNADEVRVELLIPLGRKLNAIEGRDVWGRLVKTDRANFIPHDILMWKDTGEHFDVFIGSDRVEDTQPNWGYNPPAPPNWTWQSVGVGDVVQPPAPPNPPDIPPDDSTPGRPNVPGVIWIDLEELIERQDARFAALEAKIQELIDKPAQTLPGNMKFPSYGGTLRVFGQVVRVDLDPKP